MAPVREEDVTLFLRALRFAAQRHREQRRKDAVASPYVNHLIAVAETLWCEGGIRDTATIVSGVLHDTIEDTGTVPEEIESHFGKAVRAIVAEVTDDKGLPKAARKRIQVESAPWISQQAKRVKLADKICNLEDIMASPPTGWAEERKLRIRQVGQAGRRRASRDKRTARGTLRRAICAGRAGPGLQ